MGAKLQIVPQTPLTSVPHPPTVPVRTQGPSDQTWFGWLQPALKRARDAASKPASSSQLTPMFDVHEPWMFVQPCGPAVDWPPPVPAPPSPAGAADVPPHERSAKPDSNNMPDR